MSKRKDGQERGKYTLEFKLEAVRLVVDPYAQRVVGVGDAAGSPARRE